MVRGENRNKGLSVGKERVNLRITNDANDLRVRYDVPEGSRCES